MTDINHFIKKYNLSILNYLINDISNIDIMSFYNIQDNIEEGKFKIYYNYLEKPIEFYIEYTNNFNKIEYYCYYELYIGNRKDYSIKSINSKFKDVPNYINITMENEFLKPIILFINGDINQIRKLSKYKKFI